MPGQPPHATAMLCHAAAKLVAADEKSIDAKNRCTMELLWDRDNPAA
jgi:hypothetical protein